MTTCLSEQHSATPLPDTGPQYAVSVMMNIVNTICEHESDLTLTSLLNYLDLYRTYLTYDTAQVSTACEHTTYFTAIPIRRALTDCVGFEQFVGDSNLLLSAAAAASAECGGTVEAPPALLYSVNGNPSP